MWVPCSIAMICCSMVDHWAKHNSEAECSWCCTLEERETAGFVRWINLSLSYSPSETSVDHYTSNIHTRWLKTSQFFLCLFPFHLIFLVSFPFHFWFMLSLFFFFPDSSWFLFFYIILFLASFQFLCIQDISVWCNWSFTKVLHHEPNLIIWITSFLFQLLLHHLLPSLTMKQLKNACHCCPLLSLL